MEFACETTVETGMEVAFVAHLEPVHPRPYTFVRPRPATLLRRLSELERGQHDVVVAP